MVFLPPSKTPLESLWELKESLYTSTANRRANSSLSSSMTKTKIKNKLAATSNFEGLEFTCLLNTFKYGYPNESAIKHLASIMANAIDKNFADSMLCNNFILQNSEVINYSEFTEAVTHCAKILHSGGVTFVLPNTEAISLNDHSIIEKLTGTLILAYNSANQATKSHTSTIALRYGKLISLTPTHIMLDTKEGIREFKLDKTIAAYHYTGDEELVLHFKKPAFREIYVSFSRRSSWSDRVSATVEILDYSGYKI